MCGIISSFNEELVKSGLDILKPRGSDNTGTITVQGYHLGHVLHSIVGHEPQPITRKGTLIANCEIYNWKQLAEFHKLDAKNDADLLLQLLDLHSASVVLEQLDGIYAFVYVKDNMLLAARDLLGVKPLFYTKDGDFASENKALSGKGTELNPRKLLYYNLEKKELFLQDRNFYSLQVQNGDEEEFVEHFKELFLNAVAKRIPEQRIKVGILLSGGVDSTMIAKACKDYDVETVCYTASLDNPEGENPHDLDASKLVAKNYNLKHKIITATKEEIPALAKEVVDLIESTDAVKVAVGIPFLLCAKEAAKDGCKVLFSGLGAEEIMAGYKRHKDSENINEECLKGLFEIHDRDLYRDDVITQRNGVELRLPFLDRPLVEFSLTVPQTLKIKDNHQKYLLRLAAEKIGLTNEDAFRPKKAAQYGSRFDRALKKLANSKGMKRAEYLETLK